MRKTLLAMAAVCLLATAGSASACCRKYYGCGYGYGCYAPCYAPCYYYVPTCCGYGYGGYGYGGGVYYGYNAAANYNSLYTYRKPIALPTIAASRVYAPQTTASRARTSTYVAPTKSVLTPAKSETFEPAPRTVRYTYN